MARRLKRIRPPDILDRALDRVLADAETGYVVDCRSIDIPNTIAAMVRNLPYGTVAVSLRPYGADMIRAAERAARRRGIRILWIPMGKAVRGTDEDGLQDQP